MRTLLNTLLVKQPALPWGFLARCLFLAGGLVFFPVDGVAQPPVARDYEIKAGYLIRFTQYTVWPPDTFPSSNTPVIIGVLGGDKLFKQLEREARSGSTSRPVEVRRLATVEEGLRCHVVFLGEEESENEVRWYEALKGKPILTVGESDRAIARGSVMRFVILNNTVRFEANLAAAAKNQLELNERMLAVASKVYRAQEGKTTP